MEGSPDVPVMLMPWDASRLQPSTMTAEQTYGSLGLPTLDQILNPTIARPPASPLLGSGVLAPEYQNLAGNVSAAPDTIAPPSAFGNFFKSMIGTKDTPGWGNLALGGANSLLQGYLGMRQYALAKKSLAEGRRQFNVNFDAQRKLTNSQLEDRQRARVASGNSGYESVSDYMQKYGI